MRSWFRGRWNSSDDENGNDNGNGNGNSYGNGYGNGYDDNDDNDENDEGRSLSASRFVVALHADWRYLYVTINVEPVIFAG